MKRVRQDLKIDIKRQAFWCDSTITLCWVNGESSRWKAYVANRVAEIQSLTNISEWRHVPTKENAADILTRGCNAKFLQNHRLWWHGPEWLLKDEEYWPNAETKYDFNKGIPPEIKINAHASITITDFELFEKFSDLSKLVRIMAYVLRYLNNLKGGNEKRVGILTVDETQRALISLIKIAQTQAWGSEIHALRKGEAMKSSSNLLQFNPFLDSLEVLRVGGRLEHSDLNYDAKHQIILPPGHKLTELIAVREHVRHMHCGPQLLLAVLRERYWIVSGRKLTRKVVHRCVKWLRTKPKSLEPLMGDLPAERLTMSFAFENCGVDYGGPFYIKDKRTRGCKQIKCYICIFVCFSTKAVHLELASDLSANCFIFVLRRFVARRGKPSRIFSDNATNFIGTKNELRHLVGTLQRQINEGRLANYFLSEEIKWKTIPPRTPNFAGLWEASVKSVKHHLRRVASSASLVFEEFYTILAQVEAILNSRPICPMNSNPNDLNSLTPSHFLIGRPMTTVIDEQLADFNPNRLVRYQRVQQIVQHFWKRWALEYLSELQTRVKWKRPELFKLEPGMLVVVREDNLPPCKLLLGRVVKLFPEADGAIRVVTVKTSAGEIKRGVRRFILIARSNIR